MMKAMLETKQIVALAPASQHDLYGRAWAHRRAGDMNGALADYKELRSRFPK